VGSVTSIIVAILGLGFLILVHETGHFLAAKAFGMRVEEFSLGFGRYLWSRRWGETIYGVSMFPVGGYVRVTGMHEEEFQARVDAAREAGEYSGRDAESRLTGRSAISDEEVAQTPLDRRYYARPVWQRIVFIVSGVTMNVIIAFVLLYLVALQGYVQPTTVVAEVSAGSAAAAAGMQVGDRVVSIAGISTGDWVSVQQAISSHPGESIPLVVERANAETNLTATVGTRPDGTGILGLRPATETVRPGVIGSVRVGATRTYDLFAATLGGIKAMVTGKASVTGPEGLAGPVGIVTISSEAVRGGFFLSLLAFISVQLAILNMLPLLPLDGGHVLFNVVEKITGRRMSLRAFERISVIGISLFLLLAIVATSNDIGRLFSGKSGL
jgi:regulator of sigma E protease